MPKMTDNSASSWTPAYITQPQYSLSRGDDGSRMKFTVKNSSTLSDLFQNLCPWRRPRSRGEALEAEFVRTQRELRRQERARSRRENQSIARQRSVFTVYENQAPVREHSRFASVNHRLGGSVGINPSDSGWNEQLADIQEEMETSASATPIDGLSANEVTRMHWTDSVRLSPEQQRQNSVPQNSYNLNERHDRFAIDREPGSILVTTQASEDTGALSMIDSQSRENRRSRHWRGRSSLSHAAGSMRRGAERRLEERRGDHLRRLRAQSYHAVAQVYFEALVHLRAARYWFPQRHRKATVEGGSEPMMIPLTPLSPIISGMPRSPRMPGEDDEQGFGGMTPLTRHLAVLGE